MSGLDLFLAALDHCTQHRASAEMYLRVKASLHLNIDSEFVQFPSPKSLPILPYQYKTDGRYAPVGSL
jgi:hypothetical protein